MVDRLSAFLKTTGLKIWKDDEGGITDNMLKDMADAACSDAVQNAALMIVCMSEAYCSSANCRQEIADGANMGTKMIVVNLEPKLKLDDKGLISVILAAEVNDKFQI